MKILIINPNSDEGMTAAIQESAEGFAGDAFDVRTVSTPGAPQFIESHGDEILCGPGMMGIMEESEGDFDAFVIACHSDVHIEAMRETTRKPVIGIGEASMKLASFLGRTFSVVTTHQHLYFRVAAYNRGDRGHQCFCIDQATAYTIGLTAGIQVKITIFQHRDHHRFFILLAVEWLSIGFG